MAHRVIKHGALGERRGGSRAELFAACHPQSVHARRRTRLLRFLCLGMAQDQRWTSASES